MARKYDERFDELTGLVTKVVGRVDEMHLEMRDMRKEATEMRSEMLSNAEQASGRFDKLETAVNAIYHDLVPKTIEIRKDVDRISETQTEQSFKIIELLNRADDVDRALKKLDKRSVEIDSEVKEIRKTIVSFIDPILDGKTLWANISHIEERIARLEEKVS